MSDVPLPLDYKEQLAPPKRPSRYDPLVKRAAAEKCLDDAVIEWAQADYKPAERDDWIGDLTDVMCVEDGYEAAKRLDDYRHWAVNFELCEILDGSWIWQAERDALLLWVTNNCIKPKFEIGKQVDTPHGRGEIVHVDVACATYTVQTEDWLAKNPSQVGKKGGYVILFEHVT